MVCVARVASVLIFPWLDRMAGVSFLFTKAPDGGVVAVMERGRRWILRSSARTKVVDSWSRKRSTLRTEESTQNEDDPSPRRAGAKVASAGVTIGIVLISRL